MRIIAVAPYLMAGGCEAIHQLVHVANDCGLDARIYYLPGQDVPRFGFVPAYERRYKQLERIDFIPDTSDTLVILPEGMADTSNQFSAARVAIWHLGLSGVRRFSLEQIRPETLHFACGEPVMKTVAREWGVTPYRLDAFMAVEYFEEAPCFARRGFITNLRDASRAIELLGGRNLTIIESGLSTRRVIDLMDRSMFWLEVGEGSTLGVDRGPQEAALRGSNHRSPDRDSRRPADSAGSVSRRGPPWVHPERPQRSRVQRAHARRPPAVVSALTAAPRRGLDRSSRARSSWASRRAVCTPCTPFELALAVCADL